MAIAMHRRCGAAATRTLLDGMLVGAGSFLAFCFVVAATVSSAGLLAGFVLAVACAVAMQALAIRLTPLDG